jgi:hypothetical protein
VTVPEGPKQPRRFVGVSIKDVAFFLLLYAALFLVLHSVTYRGVRRFNPMATGPSALIALIVVIVVAVYTKTRHR